MKAATFSTTLRVLSPLPIRLHPAPVPQNIHRHLVPFHNANHSLAIQVQCITEEHAAQNREIARLREALASRNRHVAALLMDKRNANMKIIAFSMLLTAVMHVREEENKQMRKELHSSKATVHALHPKLRSMETKLSELSRQAHDEAVALKKERVDFFAVLDTFTARVDEGYKTAQKQAAMLTRKQQEIVMLRDAIETLKATGKSRDTKKTRAVEKMSIVTFSWQGAAYMDKSGHSGSTNKSTLPLASSPVSSHSQTESQCHSDNEGEVRAELCAALKSVKEVASMTERVKAEAVRLSQCRGLIKGVVGTVARLRKRRYVTRSTLGSALDPVLDELSLLVDRNTVMPGRA